MLDSRGYGELYDPHHTPRALRYHPPDSMASPSITVANGASSSAAAREILAASVAPHGTAESDAILEEKDWRWGYAKHFVSPLPRCVQLVWPCLPAPSVRAARLAQAG